jgi:catechol 2,3-dioxygenase-like lactoylglutathione lyase family enzyme
MQLGKKIRYQVPGDRVFTKTRNLEPDNRKVFMILDHIQLAMPSGEETKARRFYGELLELQEIEKPEPSRTRGGCWFQLGADQLNFTSQLHLGVETAFKPAKKAHPAFRVENYEGLQQHLREAGFTVTPDDVLKNVERFYTHDPFGNRLEFIKEVVK